MCSVLNVKGQSVYKRKDTTYIVKHDTINIRGIIYGFDGKPATNLRVGFPPKNFHPPGFPTVTKTDEKGNFELKGASANDDLAIWDGRYSNVLYPVNGSRYMAIYLPPARIGHAVYDTVRITSIRKTPKITPSFTIHNDGNPVLWHVVEILPNPKIGQARFRRLLKDSLNYPPKAITNNIEGVVEIGFQTNAQGDPYDFVTLKGIGYGCEEQVVELIKKSGKWRPGVYWGAPFYLQQTVTVQFKLTDK